MKKTIAILGMSVFICSGCSLPFTTNTEKETVSQIESMTSDLSASTSIDKNLEKELSKYKEGFDAKEAKQKVVQAKKSQYDLYESIRREEVNSDAGDVQRVYGNMIQSRIKTYDLFLEAVEDGKLSVLEFALKNQKSKEKEQTDKSLLQVNETLKKAGKKEKKSLYDRVK